MSKDRRRELILEITELVDNGVSLGNALRLVDMTNSERNEIAKEIAKSYADASFMYDFT